MSNLSNIGSLMSLYLDNIAITERTDASEFLINAAANLLKQNGGRNWIPLIVKEIGENKYEAIANSFIYAVAEKAGLERLWCIIAEDTNNAIEITKVLAREKMPKVNLASASREEIKAGLQYLIDQPGSALKTVKLAVATNRIDEASRQSWQNLDPIIQLKCGITKGKKLEALKEVFYIEAKPVIALSSTEDHSSKKSDRPDIHNLQKMTTVQLKQEAKKRDLTVTSKMKKFDIIELILNAESKIDLNT
ncbi:Rho termination factor N-terminal domain-containing protein [Merismopedia glauca]|uniref:Rho termination factor n=1 Tax=Merismopedia glauca CCAP 1448/3 TaxID=1296344 RepID=A0A2T1BZV1_9CYAN|nr:Rho termination factor N-terminal domain-containing protein [Merismopedia glauca]PSB01438.1 Rho termination factor [Merismopedia glauca CCAP 1448/3]